MRTIDHHTKYKELDGIDEILSSNRSDHLKEHKVLRFKGRFIKNPSKLDTHVVLKAGQRNHANKNRIQFSTKLDKFARLQENIDYWPSTGNVGYTASWVGNFTKVI